MRQGLISCTDALLLAFLTQRVVRRHRVCEWSPKTRSQIVVLFRKQRLTSPVAAILGSVHGLRRSDLPHCEGGALWLSGTGRARSCKAQPGIGGLLASLPRSPSWPSFGFDRRQRLRSESPRTLKPRFGTCCLPCPYSLCCQRHVAHRRRVLGRDSGELPANTEPLRGHDLDSTSRRDQSLVFHFANGPTSPKRCR